MVLCDNHAYALSILKKLKVIQEARVRRTLDFSYGLRL